MEIKINENTMWSICAVCLLVAVLFCLPKCIEANKEATIKANETKKEIFLKYGKDAHEVYNGKKKVNKDEN